MKETLSAQNEIKNESKGSKNFTLELSSNGSEKFISIIMQNSFFCYVHTLILYLSLSLFVTFTLTLTTEYWDPCASHIFKTININRQNTIYKRIIRSPTFQQNIVAHHNVKHTKHIYKKSTHTQTHTFVLWLQYIKRWIEFLLFKIYWIFVMTSSPACLRFDSYFFFLVEYKRLEWEDERQRNLQPAEKKCSQ